MYDESIALVFLIYPQSEHTKPLWRHRSFYRLLSLYFKVGLGYEKICGLYCMESPNL